MKNIHTQNMVTEARGMGSLLIVSNYCNSTVKNENVIVGLAE